MKYIVYQTDGRLREIEQEKEMTLEQIQEVVGGYAEGWSCANGHYLMFNEDALLLRLPLNPHWVCGVRLRGNVIEGQISKNGTFLGL